MKGWSRDKNIYNTVVIHSIKERTFLFLFSVQNTHPRTFACDASFLSCTVALVEALANTLGGEWQPLRARLANVLGHIRHLRT